jgi:hypothetical protein
MMKTVVTVIRGKDLRKPLTPLYRSLRSIQVPHLFFVPPGHDERQVTFEAPFSGKIHFLGAHLHRTASPSSCTTCRAMNRYGKAHKK